MINVIPSNKIWLLGLISFSCLFLFPRQSYSGEKHVHSREESVHTEQVENRGGEAGENGASGLVETLTDGASMLGSSLKKGVSGVAEMFSWTDSLLDGNASRSNEGEKRTASDQKNMVSGKEERRGKTKAFTGTGFSNNSEYRQTDAKKVTTGIRSDAEVVSGGFNPLGRDDNERSLITKVRGALFPKVGAAANMMFGGYGSYTLSKKECVGRVAMSLEETENMLKELGFERNLMAAFKYRSDGRPSAGSWRLAEGNHQYHITLFKVDGGIELNAHREMRWEPDVQAETNPEETGYMNHHEKQGVPGWVPDALVRSYKHYHPHAGGHYSPEEGVQHVRSMLESQNISFQPPEH